MLKEKELGNDGKKERQGVLEAIANFLWEEGKSSYEPVWPVSSSNTSIHYIV